MVTKTFLTSGSWPVPAGTTSVTVKCWGGGAGGGDGDGDSVAGGGGGGGAFAQSTLSCTPGTNVSYVVAPSVPNVTNGSDTTWNTTSVVAKGGTKGTTGGAGGAGGTTGASTGTIKRAGGNGHAGVGVNGGGGGGGAGDAAAGSSSADATGGAGGTAGGGAGGATDVGGSDYGGGGGGGNVSGIGGGGAAGKIIITYTVPAAVTSTTTGGRWSHSASLGDAGSIQMKAGPTGSVYVIDSLMITGNSGASAGTITITSSYKHAAKTLFTYCFPTTAPFQHKRRTMALKAVRMGDITVTTSANVTVTVTVTGHTEEDRVPGVVETVEDGEYVVLDLVQPNAAEPVVSYAYTGQMVSVRDEETGTMMYPQRAYTLAAATAADPWAESSYTIQGTNEFHTVFFSARNGQITRWHTTITGQPLVKWMTRIDNGGRSLGCATYEQEHWATTSDRRHNPTTGISQVRPTTGLYNLASLQRMTPSVIIPGTFNYQGAATASDRGYIETCVIPPEWTPDGADIGFPDGSADHGGDDDHPGLWYPHRHYVRVDHRVTGLEGTHRITFWGYKPRQRASTTSALHGIGPSLVNIFTRAEWRTIGDPVPYRLTTFTGSTVGFAEATAVNIEGSGDMSGESSVSSPFSTAYVASALVKSVDPLNPAATDFTVALATKLHDEFHIANPSLKPSRMAVTRLSDAGFNYVLPVEDEAAGFHLGATGRSLAGHRTGWIPQNSFLIICKYSDLGTRLDALLASGLMEESATFTALPAAAILGTRLAL